MAKLEKTKHPGIYRRHAGSCGRGPRCDCSYVVVWRHRGKQYTDTYRTLAEAREAKGNKDAGDRRPESRVTVQSYYDGWIEGYAGRTARGFSERSRKLYRLYLERHALPAWGTWKLADVEPTDIRAKLNQLRDRGVSTMELKQLRSALSAMFATAAEDGVLRSNPVTGVRIPTPRVAEEDPQPKAMSREELALVLTALPEGWRLFFEFLAHTGLRISEAVGLTWAHVDLGANPHIKVREQFHADGERAKLKSNASRRDIPLSPGMAQSLRELRRDAFKGAASPVFQTTTGTELKEANVRSRVLRPTVDALGLSWVTPHTFRHTCASLLFEGGKNVKQVSRWLGHAKASFTLDQYISLMDDGVGSADFLDASTDSGQHGSTQRPQTEQNVLGLARLEKAA